MSMDFTKLYGFNFDFYVKNDPTYIKMIHESVYPHLHVESCIITKFIVYLNNFLLCLSKINLCLLVRTIS